MQKAWISSLAFGAVLAAAPINHLAAQNPNNEFFLQSFMSSNVPTMLMNIFVPNVSFAAGTTFDIRTFNGTTLGATSLFSAVLAGQAGGPLSLSITPNILLAANTMYAIAVVGTNIPSSTTDQAFAGGSIYFRNDALSPWVNQNVDVAGFAVTMSPVTSTPEPASVALMATGFVGLGGVGLRRRNRRAET